MCVSCGCKQPNDDHGDSRNITMHDLERAAEAAGTDVQGVMRNMQETFQSGQFAATGARSQGDQQRQS